MTEALTQQELKTLIELCKQKRAEYKNSRFAITVEYMHNIQHLDLIIKKLEEY